MSILDVLVLLALAGLVAVFVVARSLAGQLRRTGKRMEHHLERRLVDAVLIALGLSWLTGRRGHRGQRSRPAPPRPPALEGDEIYRACPLSRWQGDPAACRWCNGLLPDGRPRFCGPACTDWALDNHDFDHARAARRRMDRYQCVRCGRREHLEVNHIVPVLGRHDVPGCWHHLAGLQTLCGGGGQSCHQIETNRQRAAGEFGPHPRRIGA